MTTTLKKSSRQQLIDNFKISNNELAKLEKQSPTLAEYIKNFDGFIEKNKKEGALYLPQDKTIYIGSNYTFISGSKVSVNGKDDLILALAHELGHAIGHQKKTGFQRKPLTDAEYSKKSAAITYKTAAEYEKAGHMEEAEALYAEYRVAKELGKLAAWKAATPINEALANLIESKVLSNQYTVKNLYTDIATILDGNTFYGGQNFPELQNWSYKELPIAYTYSEKYQAFYLNLFTNLNADYKEAMGEDLFSANGILPEFNPDNIRSLDKMVQLKSLLDELGNYSLYKANNPDNFKKAAENNQSSLKGDEIKHLNGTGNTYVNELIKYKKMIGLDEETYYLMYGGDGNDKLYGNASDEILLGGAGIDYLYGGAGNDILAGNAGDDRLYDEKGSDILKGGKGFDKYIFTKNADGTIGYENDVNTIIDEAATHTFVVNGKKITDRDNRGQILLGGDDEKTGAIALDKVDWKNGDGLWYSEQFDLKMEFFDGALEISGYTDDSKLKGMIKIANVNLENFKLGLVFGLTPDANESAYLAYFNQPDKPVTTVATAYAHQPSYYDNSLLINTELYI